MLTRPCGRIRIGCRVILQSRLVPRPPPQLLEPVHHDDDLGFTGRLLGLDHQEPPAARIDVILGVVSALERGYPRTAAHDP